MAIDASGNIYTTGLFQDSVDFDPGASTFNLTAGVDEIFVSKIDGMEEMRTIDVNGYRSGTYLVTYVDDAGNRTEKFMVK